VQQLDVLHSMADVAGIAVKPHERNTGFPVWNEPAVETDAIGSGEEKILEFQANLTRRMDNLGAWMED
jgi:hypothetical protein